VISGIGSRIARAAGGGRAIACAGVVALVMTANTATAVVNLNRALFRTPMPNEGYVQHVPDGFDLHGRRWAEEWTGWVDVRHPAMDGVQDAYYPFDRSDHRVDVHTVLCSDNSVPAVPAAPNRPRDFDFSCKIYAQGGFSAIREAGDATLHLNGAGGAPDVTWPINKTDQDDAMKCLQRSPNATTINAWYVQAYGPPCNGLASPPRFFGANIPRNDGVGVANSAETSTFAHELGHMMLNGHASEDNNDATNFMYHTGSSYALTDVGITKGKMPLEQINRVYENTGANNPGFLQHPDGDHRFGHRVDWDFVAHANDLESAQTGADNHEGTDWLHWRIGHTETEPPPTHDHTGLGVFPPTPDFADPTFRYADVFSLTLRYADFDSPDSGLYNSFGALDYWTYFEDSSGAIHPGEMVTIFQHGWTETTCVDNWLARWRSPVDAVGVYTLPRAGTAYDGNLQIDAVIVSAIPEPVTLALLVLGLLYCRRR